MGGFHMESIRGTTALKTRESQGIVPDVEQCRGSGAHSEDRTGLLQMTVSFEWLIFVCVSLNDAANSSVYVTSDNSIGNNE